MKLSIITICYNDAEALKLTAESISTQINKNFEWVVIDGGSKDKSIEIIKEYEEFIAFWVSEPDKGIFNAQNKGVLHSNGDYCLFLNAGDVFCSPKSIERAFSRNWNADIISCDEFVISEKKYYDYIQAPRKVTFHRILLGYLPHQTTFIKRSLLKEYPYKEDYRIVADWAFWWQTLVASNHSYQHFDFPLAAFDLTGVSSTNTVGNHHERDVFLENYIPNKILRDRIISECGLFKTIEGDFLFNSERSLIYSIVLLIRRIYVHIFQPLYTIWQNIRWRG